ncbi:uncharacterized protein LOC125607204 [Brassica napus]|uniref:uncharacterized protein LOC125607204 n=1 Tax=Brassica napus TaxID=3708 RepID=UPI002078E333|nr:uncharacterized protein LOC125607204 [Brassica napus]
MISGTLPGVKIGHNCPPINHLLFADDTMFFGKSSSTSCRALTSILTRYEAASGQCINRAKSAVTFSSKTNLVTKMRVKQELNITNEGGIGKYLGLPEHFGRRKRDIFAEIVDRIRQKAHGWTARYLSTAGKMVLLKTVLAVMPTYAMSCFKLPKSLCKQIQSVLTRFWWDAKPEVKKMCWVAWDKLTLPKGAGGLGFREIEVFNDALLAKHAWRLLKNPTSLLGRTLLTRYCRHDSFLDCHAPNSASHGWRGILAGREILKKGLGWAIGNGNTVKVWSDNWLSTTHQMCPIGPPREEENNLLVSDLMLPDSTLWNIEKIRDCLPHYEAQIRSIVPSDYGMCDTLVWLADKTGNYTTKSGYATANLNVEGRASDFNWHRCVWNVNCSPKLKSFLWKLSSNAMAVGESLLKRGLRVDGACKRCGQLETIAHVMFLCPFAVRVWEAIPAMCVPSPVSTKSIETILSECLRMVNLPPSGLTTPLYPWVMWVLWTSRNQLVFENKSFSETEVLGKALKHAKEWQHSMAQASPRSGSSKDCASKAIQTQHPSDVYYCYSDAAWKGASSAGGMGWTFTNAAGDTRSQGAVACPFVASALVAEALALKEAIKAAISLNIKDLICFSDSRGLINMITASSSVIALQGILHDISVLSLSFSSICFKFVPRLSNTIADRLAKEALSLYLNPSVVRRNLDN